MATASLHYKGSRVPVLCQFFCIGREDDCDLYLEDDLVSRRHALIVGTGETWFLIDLKSSNGLCVNDERVSECALAPGDRIRIGEQDLVFAVGDQGGPAGTDLPEAQPRKRMKISSPQRTKPVLRPPAEVLKEDLLERHLKILYRSLGTATVFEAILDVAMGLMGADRGLTVFKQGGKLRVTSFRSRDGEEDFDVRAFHVRAIVDKVVARAEALLTHFGSVSDQPPQEGTRFLNVESILCVPATLEGQLMGVIYVENKVESHSFIDGDLEVMRLFASHAAAAFDNAQRYDRHTGEY